MVPVDAVLPQDVGHLGFLVGRGFGRGVFALAISWGDVGRGLWRHARFLLSLPWVQPDRLWPDRDGDDCRRIDWGDDDLDHDDYGIIISGKIIDLPNMYMKI